MPIRRRSGRSPPKRGHRTAGHPNPPARWADRVVETTAGATARPDQVPIAALLGATAVSLVGSALTAVALPWFVLRTTGSATRSSE